MLAADLTLHRSPLSIWERLTRPEDICAYGSCIILPLLVAFALTAVALVIWFIGGRLNKKSR